MKNLLLVSALLIAVLSLGFLSSELIGTRSTAQVSTHVINTEPTHAPEPEPTPSPTLSFSASPTSVTSGQSATLSWSAMNTTSCTASGGWSGTKSISGSQSVSPTSNTIYTLTCSGEGGGVVQSTSVVVTTNTTVTTPTENTIQGLSLGDWVEVTANNLNVRSQPDGKRLGAQRRGAQGQLISGPIVIRNNTWWNVDYTSGVDGWSAGDYLVQYSEHTPSPTPEPEPTPSPTLSFSAIPSSITSGQSATLSWSAMNTTSCTASGGWSGTKPVSGRELVSPTSNTTYTLTCVRDNENISQSTSVIVTAPLAPSTKFQISDNIQTTANLNVRSTANGTLLGTQLQGATGSVVGGPVVAGGFNWWNINYTSGVDGWSAEDYLVKITISPLPSLLLSASPPSITSGQSATLSWSAMNTTSCTASGGWSGTKSISGSQSVSPTSNTTYTLTCTNTLGSATQSATINVGAVTTTPPPTFSGDLVVFPNKNVEFIIGPQVKANSSSNPWPWHDQNMITKGLEHGNNFPATPLLEPIDNDVYLNRNYYDLGLTLYTAYYRTGDAQFLTLARKVTDSWWQHDLIKSGTVKIEDSMTPRSISLAGLMLRALDGRPEMWPWIESFVRYQHWVWVERFVAYPALRGGVRDEGYMLLYASLLAEVHPDPTVRTEFKNKALVSARDYFARLQYPDGGWYWGIDTDGDPNTPDINASQPFQVGLLIEGMIKIHQITGDKSIEQSIIKSADWLYAKSYETQPATNLTNVLWRAMRYFTIQSDYTSNNRTSAFQYGMADGGIRDARELNPTTIHTFGYAYKLTDDPKYKTYGDEVFSATFGKGQGPGADQYYGLADFRAKEFNQNYRSASRYLAWRLGF